MYGIYVENTAGIPYANSIVYGYKRIETRNRNTLKNLLEKRVAIIRKEKNKKPMVIGYVTIAYITHCTAEEFPLYFTFHCVPPGSKYDSGKNGKYLYWLEQPEPCKPYTLPETRVMHGRAYCEF